MATEFISQRCARSGSARVTIRYVHSMLTRVHTCNARSLQINHARLIHSSHDCPSPLCPPDPLSHSRNAPSLLLRAQIVRILRLHISISPLDSLIAPLGYQPHRSLPSNQLAHHPLTPPRQTRLCATTNPAHLVREGIHQPGMICHVERVGTG